MVFTYNIVYRLIYKFGNIPATIAVLLYIIGILSPEKIIHQLYAGIMLILLVAINRYFLYLYRTVPFSISIKDNCLIATQFTLSDKIVTVPLDSIKDIKGGIFDARYGSLIRIYTGEKHAKIAFFLKINNSRELQDFLLKHISKDLYNTIMLRLGIKKDKQKQGKNDE